MHFLRLIFLVLLTGLSAVPAYAGNSFSDYVVKEVNKWGFHGCETALRSFYNGTSGRDIKVSTGSWNGLKNHQLILTSMWGSRGDSIVTTNVVTKHNDECFMSTTNTTIINKSCIMYLNDLKNYRLVTEFLDYWWLENQNGIINILKTVNSSCLSVAKGTARYPID